MQLTDSSTIYFYCQYDNPETCTSISILKGLLYQAIDQRPDLIPYLNEQRRLGGGPTLELEKLARRLMEIVCQGGSRKYIIIDGLDECTSDNRFRILNFLMNLIQDLDVKEPGKKRLLIVSQNESDIKKALLSAQELELKWEHNRNDIEQFVARWARNIGDKFELNEEQEDYIRSITCRRAAGGTW